MYRHYRPSALKPVSLYWIVSAPYDITTDGLSTSLLSTLNDRKYPVINTLNAKVKLLAQQQRHTYS